MQESRSEGTVIMIYGAGWHPTRGWQTLHIIARRGPETLGSVAIARDALGTIVRLVDPWLDVWELTEDPEDLHRFQRFFAESDRLIQQQQKQLAEPDNSHPLALNCS